MDDLLSPRPAGPKMADYLLFGRRYVVELKCITTNHWATDRHKARLLKVLSRGMAEGQCGAKEEIGRRVLPDGRTAIRYRVDETSDARYRGAFVDAMARPMRRVFDYASKQIRSTASEFGLTNFHGLLVVVNLADQQLTPNNVYWLTNRLINEHPQTIDYVAFYSPHIGGRLPDGRRASLYMSMIRSGADAGVGSEVVNDLMRGWLDFNAGNYLDLNA